MIHVRSQIHIDRNKYLSHAREELYLPSHVTCIFPFNVTHNDVLFLDMAATTFFTYILSTLYT